jgi:hypothetical protein
MLRSHRKNLYKKYYICIVVVPCIKVYVYRPILMSSRHPHAHQMPNTSILTIKGLTWMCYIRINKNLCGNPHLAKQSISNYPHKLYIQGLDIVGLNELLVLL